MEKSKEVLVEKTGTCSALHSRGGVLGEIKILVKIPNCYWSSDPELCLDILDHTCIPRCFTVFSDDIVGCIHGFLHTTKHHSQLVVQGSPSVLISTANRKR